MSLNLPDPYVELERFDEASVRELAERLQRNLEKIAKAITLPPGLILTGSGNPNGAVTASPPALWLRTDGGAGATLYVKETGSNTNTGWVAK